MKQILIISFLLLVTFVNAIIINIPAEHTTFYSAISASVNGDTILVQPGTYLENISYAGKNITIGSLYLTTQDTTYISLTILDGFQNGSVVTFDSGEDSTAVLTGFTITNGYNYNNGGGIYCNNSNPSLQNVTISGNSASSNGGGIYFYYNSSPSLINVTISGNSASSYGGGIYCYNNSSPSLENVIISDNSASSRGGGIYCGINSSPSLENVTISNNSAYSGGGIYCDHSSSPSLENVIISDNSASSRGGGISCQDYSNPSLQNVTIVGNSASYDGGGIYCEGDSDPELVNCILWNDAPYEIYLNQSDDTITISYSDIQGGESGIVGNGVVYWLIGNIDSDPIFVDSLNGDFHLQWDSPCIDTGHPDLDGDGIAWLTDPDDQDPDGTRMDMGAYYYDQSGTIFPPIANFYANPLQGYTLLNVEFTNQSVPGSGAILEWKWYFGDGDSLIVGSLTNPNHIYQNPGIFSVSLTVTDEYDSTDTEIRQDYITVYAGEPPAAPTNINIEIVGDNALITWSPVDSTIYGNPIIVDFYIVMFSEIANQDSLFFYLNYTPNTYYYHNGVALFRDHMFYRVSSFIGTSDELEEYVEKYLRKPKDNFLIKQ